VFFDGARTPAENVLGPINGGWKIAMATLGFERGVSTLGQQLAFENELQLIVQAAKENGAIKDARIRQRLARAFSGLRIMRWHALRTLGGSDHQLNRAAMIGKLYWASWHRGLGELAMDILGPRAEILASPPYELTPFQRLFLFSRADTIYAGTNEIQRTLIGERGLGLPPEPRKS
jgi:alkylation response protein AidB-like acyl-CoA dehydrogenase